MTSTNQIKLVIFDCVAQRWNNQTELEQSLKTKLIFQVSQSEPSTQRLFSITIAKDTTMQGEPANVIDRHPLPPSGTFLDVCAQYLRQMDKVQMDKIGRQTILSSCCSQMPEHCRMIHCIQPTYWLMEFWQEWTYDRSTPQQCLPLYPVSRLNNSLAMPNAIRTQCRSNLTL